MKFPFFLLLLAGFWAAAPVASRGQQARNAAPAQKPAAPMLTIHLKDGQAIETPGVRREGSSVMAKVQLADGREGEAGYEVANISKIEFPDPGQLKIATDLLTRGRADEALKQLAPAVAYYAPFRDIPGSWWTALALVRLDADNGLGREAEADAIANDLARLGAIPPDVQLAIKIRQGASLEHKGEHQKALAILEPIIGDENIPPRALPEAWLSAGAADLALGRSKAALLAYLHVPERAVFMAPALLGSAIAYVGIDDRPRAKESLQQLISSYPDSREAAEAKDRLRKLNGPAPKEQQKS